MKKIFGALIGLGLLAAGPAQAGLVAYTDVTAFNTAVGLAGLATTVEDFEGTASGTIVSSGSAVGGITFTYGPIGMLPGGGPIELAVTDGSPFGGGGPFSALSGTNFLGTNDGDVLAGGEDFTMSFAAAGAIGLHILTAEIPDFTLFDGDLNLTVGGVTASLALADLLTTLPDGTDVYFLGIVDDMGGTFTSADFTTAGVAVGAVLHNVDDIVLARATAIPEPGTMALFGLGILGLSLARRTKVT